MICPTLIIEKHECVIEPPPPHTFGFNWRGLCPFGEPSSLARIQPFATYDVRLPFQLGPHKAK